MTTQLNLLGMLTAKGAPAAASASSETAAVPSPGGAIPQEGSFFSALMQMLFRQSVDPRTRTKALPEDPAAASVETVETTAPQDRVAESIRALTFLSNEKAQLQTGQIQTAMQQCGAQMKLKLPGEPGALQVSVAPGVIPAGTLQNGVEASPVDAGMLSAGDEASAAGMVVRNSDTQHDGTLLPATADAVKNEPALPVPSAPAEVLAPMQITAAAAPLIPSAQNAAGVPAAAPDDRPRGKYTQSAALPAGMPPPSSSAPDRSAVPSSVPSMLSAERTSPHTEPAVTPELPGERKGGIPHDQQPVRNEPVTRTPYSTTVPVPRYTVAVPEQPAAAPAVNGPMAPKGNVPLTVLQSGRTDNTTETEHQPQVSQHPVPEAAARSMMPQRNPRTVRTNETQRPEPGRSAGSPEHSGAAAFLDEMVRADEVTVVAVSGGADDAAHREPQQCTQQNVPAEGTAPRPAQQKDPSLPPVDRGAVGAPVPADTRTAAAPAAAVNAQPFDRTTVQSMLEQLSKGVAVAVNEHHSEMKIVMHPESLGEVTVRVQVEEGKVSTTMDVQQTQVKQTIEANIPQLREALSAKGLTMERIEVTTAQHGMTDESARNRQGNERKKGRQEFEMTTEEESSVKLYGYNTVEYTV